MNRLNLLHRSSATNAGPRCSRSEALIQGSASYFLRNCRSIKQTFLPQTVRQTAGPDQGWWVRALPRDGLPVAEAQEKNKEKSLTPHCSGRASIAIRPDLATGQTFVFKLWSNPSQFARKQKSYSCFLYVFRCFPFFFAFFFFYFLLFPFCSILFPFYFVSLIYFSFSFVFLLKSFIVFYIFCRNALFCLTDEQA